MLPGYLINDCALWVLLRPVYGRPRRSPNTKGSDCEAYPDLTLHERIKRICVRTPADEIAVRWNNANANQYPPWQQGQGQTDERTKSAGGFRDVAEAGGGG